MSKNVLLTYKNERGMLINEHVVLPNPDAEIFTMDGDSLGLNMDDITVEDLVIFQDKHGLFGIPAGSIVAIEVEGTTNE